MEPKFQFPTKFRRMVSFFELFFTLFGIAFASIFIVVGFTIVFSGITFIRDFNIFQNTPVSTIANAKPDKPAKFILKPDKNSILKSEYSKTDCIYYNTEFVNYYTSDGDTSRDVSKKASGPNFLTLSDGENIYTISLENPKPTLIFKDELYFIKDPKTKQYISTPKKSFESGDEVIEEQVFLPDEEILIFGNFKEKVQTGKNRFELKFNSDQLGSPFDDVQKYIIKLSNNVINNEQTLYIVSSRDEKGTENHFSLPVCYLFIAFGAVFALVPIGIVMSSIQSLMKTYSKLFNPQF